VSIINNTSGTFRYYAILTKRLICFWNRVILSARYEMGRYSVVSDIVREKSLIRGSFSELVKALVSDEW
jgi:hypothetical protein